MEILNLGGGASIYYDLERRIIGREPSNSNLQEKGSDNSLYMGLTNNDDIKKILLKILNLKKIEDFHNQKYSMSFYGEQVTVVTNINYNGHLQFKIIDNGHMYRLLKKYERVIGTTVNRNNLLILFDFSNEEMFFETSIENKQEEIDIVKSEKELINILQEIKQIKNINTDVDAYIETTLNVRNNYVQSNFRKNLLIEFDGKCAICAIDKKDLLVASHILPYSKCPSTKEMGDYNNGLLLCKNHDQLFDKGYISFDYRNGKIKISKEIDENLYADFNINKDIKLNEKFLTNKRIQYLATHKLK